MSASTSVSVWGRWRVVADLLPLADTTIFSASSARAMFAYLMSAGGNSVVFCVSLQNLSTMLEGEQLLNALVGSGEHDKREVKGASATIDERHVSKML
jgi:hypothetical protein